MAMAPAHHTKLQQHGPILGTAAQCGRGVCILDTCSGLSTSVSAAMRAGLSVASYVAVEKEERVRAMASHHLRQLHLKYGPARLPVEAFSAAFTTLPQDMTEATEEHIRGLGRIDLFFSSWPCQGLSRANKRGRGLHDPCSGLFVKAIQLLDWVLRYNPHAIYIFENVDFAEEHPNHWLDVNLAFAERGGGVLRFDAALVSPEHRLRAYWTNLNADGRMRPSEYRHDRDLASVLGPDHRPRLAPSSDPAVSYRLRCNVAGERMVKYPTVTKMYDEWSKSLENGTAFVENVRTGRLELPYVWEIEQILGLDAGATAAPGATEDERRKACGNIFDANVYTWFVEQIAQRLGLAAAHASEPAQQHPQHAQQGAQQHAEQEMQPMRQAWQWELGQEAQQHALQQAAQQGAQPQHGTEEEDEWGCTPLSTQVLQLWDEADHTLAAASRPAAPSMPAAVPARPAASSASAAGGHGTSSDGDQAGWCLPAAEDTPGQHAQQCFVCTAQQQQPWAAKPAGKAAGLGYGLGALQPPWPGQAFPAVAQPPGLLFERPQQQHSLQQQRQPQQQPQQQRQQHHQQQWHQQPAWHPGTPRLPPWHQRKPSLAAAVPQRVSSSRPTGHQASLQKSYPQNWQGLQPGDQSQWSPQPWAQQQCSSSTHNGRTGAAPAWPAATTTTAGASVAHKPVAKQQQQQQPCW